MLIISVMLLIMTEECNQLFLCTKKQNFVNICKLYCIKWNHHIFVFWFLIIFGHELLGSPIAAWADQLFMYTSLFCFSYCFLFFSSSSSFLFELSLICHLSAIQIKMQYVQISNIIDTSIIHPISSQSTLMVKGCLDICLIW